MVELVKSALRNPELVEQLTMRASRVRDATFRRELERYVSHLGDNSSILANAEIMNEGARIKIFGNPDDPESKSLLTDEYYEGHELRDAMETWVQRSEFHDRIQDVEHRLSLKLIIYLTDLWLELEERTYGETDSEKGQGEPK